jgi:hypothetical protein
MPELEASTMKMWGMTEQPVDYTFWLEQGMVGCVALFFFCFSTLSGGCSVQSTLIEQLADYALERVWWVCSRGRGSSSEALRNAGAGG